MMFRRSPGGKGIAGGLAQPARAVLFAAMAGCLLSPAAALAEPPTAVIPKQTIYPGEKLDASMLEVVDVTNPDLRDGYVRSIDEVDGMVTKRTLLPGGSSWPRRCASNMRSNAAPPFVSSSTMRSDDNGRRLAAAGCRGWRSDPRAQRRYRLIVSGTVMADSTIHVVAK